MRAYAIVFVALFLALSGTEAVSRVSSPASDALNRFNAIQYGIQTGDIAMVRAWLRTPGGINLRADAGSAPTFLTQAARLNRDEMVQLLLSSGANVNMPDGNKMTPLMHAAKNGNRRIVVQLLNAGAEVNDYDTWSESALSLAKQNRHPDVVSILKNAGALE